MSVIVRFGSPELIFCQLIPPSVVLYSLFVSETNITLEFETDRAITSIFPELLNVSEIVLQLVP